MDPIQLLRELVALPSVNPAFSAPGADGTGEQRVADYLAAAGARVGLSGEWMPVLPGRANLSLRLAPTDRVEHRVLLAPHLDTVGATPAQLRPVLRAGRLYGRGACDTKASVAAMFTALAAVARRRPRPAHTEIVLAALVDEEHAQAGSRALAGSTLTAELAIVGEPTRLQVVTAHKGNVWLRVETSGKAAHGAHPELGRNAVVEMARVVSLLETEYGGMLRQQRHPLLGHATISVGTIAGGVQPNIVPDHCELLADRRTLPGEDAAGVCREVQALLRLHGVRARVAESKVAPCLPMATDPALPLVREFMRHAGQRRARGVPYFCDASVLSHGGVPSVVFGPGDIAQAHTADEWVEVRQVARAAAVLERFLRALP